MRTNKRFWYFIVLLLPSCIISVLLDVLYSFEVHNSLELNVIGMIIFAIALDAGVTWWQTRSEDQNSRHS